ncbi:MAG: ATP-dependent Clp protease adapter ClpS [Bdellovibrionales bacterium]
MTHTLSPLMMSERESDPSESHATWTQSSADTQTKTKKPSLYKVYLLNDDYTPMDFVIVVLETVFNKDHEEAMRIMMQVHQSDSGLCGVYPFDVAETKVSQVLQAAHVAQHPLQCKMERA